MTTPRLAALAFSALVLAGGVSAHASEEPSGPVFLSGIAGLTKFRDLNLVSEVSKSLGLNFAIDSANPHAIDLEAKPGWLSRVDYTRYGNPPGSSRTILTLGLAQGVGCLRTEQVAAQLGHDYKLAPFFRRTDKDEQLLYVISYKYPGNPSLTVNFQPDRSGCFTTVLAESKPSP